MLAFHFRTYSLFLADLAKRGPDMMKPCLSLLMVHLDGESSSMRKCVLTIFGELVHSVFVGGEELDEAAKETRDQLLDCLEDHIHDTNAIVRANVLQVWKGLCLAKAIPIKRWERLLKLVIGRLQDKTSSVRKNAVQVLSTLLEGNPFTFNLSDEFKAQLETEKQKLKDLEEKAADRGKEREWDEKVKVHYY